MQIIRDIKSIPVLRPAIALTTGIFAGKLMVPSVNLLLMGMLATWILLLCILIFRLTLKPRHSWITGILVYLIFFCSGIMVTKRFHEGHKLIPEDSKRYWLGEVLSSPVIKNKMVRFELDLFQDSSSLQRYKAQVLMQVGNNTLLPRAGQTIILRTLPERIQGPMNPGEFDYASYLESRGLLYRCFIRDGEWIFISTQRKSSLNLVTLKLRDLLWNKIESLEPQNKNLGVLYALGLGSKELLTPEIREAYAASGAMHVLAVSGLHVGLIWMVLSYIFVWVKKLPGGRFFQFILITSLIWFYALMTGATASVVRSAAMFTLVSLGKIIQKETSVYNSLAVSAFFGLLINPQWLTDAGFQLSYVAVLSIVFFQPRISILFAPRNWLLKKTWDICSVSIAAQLGTLPLTLFYFNRFPPWFIISNLVVIPLVTIIMIVFISMLFFLMIPVVFALILKVLLFFIGIMNISVKYIEGLPSPGMDMIYLNDFQMFCFILLLLGIVFFIRYRINFFLISGLAALLFFISTGTLLKYFSLQQAELILFSVPGKMIMGIIEANNGTFLHNAPDTVDIEESFKYKCKPYIIRHGITKTVITGLNDSLILPGGIIKIPGNHNYFFRFADKSVLILNDPAVFTGIQSKNPLTIDLLIVNNRIPRLWKGQKPLFKTNQLVISSSASRYLQFIPDETGIIQTGSIFDTRSNGAFRYPLVAKPDVW